MDNRELQLKCSQLLKTMREGLVNLLQTSDKRTADAMTEAIFMGLVLVNNQQVRRPWAHADFRRKRKGD